MQNYFRCRTSRNFPEECFCWDRICSHPYMALHKIFMKLKSQGEEFKQMFPGILIKENEENFTKLFKLSLQKEFSCGQ